MDLTGIADALGTDKGSAVGDWGTAHNYTHVYETLLRDRRERPLNVLEIGVWRGASLRMWEQYLPNAAIVGIDILPDTLKQASDRSKVFVGDASDPAFLSRVATTGFSGPIDFIVDDGSHALDHQVTALKALFPFLADDGLYVVEDTAVSRFDLKIVNIAPFIDFHDYAAELATHTTFFPRTPQAAYSTVRDINALSEAEKADLAPSYWNKWLHSVSFFYNMVVLAKREQATAAPLVASGPESLEISPGAGWRARTAEEQLAEVPAHDGAGEVLQRTADELIGINVRLGVAAALARHDGDGPQALVETVSSLDGMLGTFGRQIAEARRESGRAALELRQSRSAFERTIGRLAKAEAEVEYLRQQVASMAAESEILRVEASKSPSKEAGLGAGQIDAVVRSTSESESDLEALSLVVREGEDFAAGVMTPAAERITELEDELVRTASELAQVRLVHGGLWDSHRWATSELKATQQDAASLREDLYRERAEAGGRLWDVEQERDGLRDDVERRNRDYDQKLDELSGFSRWLEEEQSRERGAARARDEAQRRLTHLADHARSLEEDLDRFSGMARERDEAQRALAGLADNARRIEDERDAARHEANLRLLTEEALHASLSWRVTAPLRWAKSLLRR